MRARTLMFALALLGLVTAAPSAQLVINEIYYDGPGTDAGTFTEILGPGDMALDGYTLVGVNGSNGEVYRTIALDGMVVPSDGRLVIAQDETVPNYDYIDSGMDWQNGPDQVQIRDAAGAPIDGICYGYSELLDCEGGTNGPDVGSGNSISRCPDGEDTDDNEADTAETLPTPGEENDCGGGPDPLDLTVCEATELDAVGFPVHYGVLVHLVDPIIILNDDGTVGSGRIDCGATDGECCIYLFDFDTYIPLFEGDEVEATGTIGFYNGKLQLTGPDFVVTVLSSGNPLPDPELITTEELATNGEQYESCLIQINDVTIVGGDWPAEGDNANLDIVDETGVPTILRIDRDTDIDGSPPPDEPFCVVGLGGQYDSSSPYDEGYQIQPRSLEDFVDCPVTEMVCCVGSDCYVTTEEDCLEMGGDWRPDLGDTCEPNPCPVATEDASWGSIKSMFK